jgi:hypothetical protein
MIEKVENGAVERDRTVDLVINSHTLYRLSYDGLVVRKTTASY